MGTFKKPALPGADLFEAVPGDDDPADRAEAGTRLALALVSQDRDEQDAAVVARALTIVDEHGIDALADLWDSAPSDSLSGALWRLYVLRTWVRRDPAGAAREFDAGRRFTPVDEVVAGVVDPPGPAEVADLADTVIRGVVTGDLADTLDRAAAFARIVGVGRAHLRETPPSSTHSAARLVETAAALESAARQERLGALR